MTQQEYEQKRAELWYEYTAMLRSNCATRYVFDQIFDRAYNLGKQEKDADTVIQGWVARDGNNDLNLYFQKPIRNRYSPYWAGLGIGINFSKESFPDLTWDSDPEPVEIIIKRKKNG